MIETKGDTTIIRPTPKKWYTGAVILLVLGLWVPEAGRLMLLFGLACAGLASGKLASLELSPRGLTSKSLWKTRAYRWDDIEDLKIVSFRTSLFSSNKVLAFSRKDKKDTFSGKASRFFSGGTETVPITGIKPEALITCIGGYQTRHMMLGKQIQQGRDFGSTAPANPPKLQTAKGAIGFGRPETSNTSEAAVRTAQTARPQPLPKAPAKPVFGRQSPSTPVQRNKSHVPKPAQHTKPKANPLVEEGGWMRKRRDGTGF